MTFLKVQQQLDLAHMHWLCCTEEVTVKILQGQDLVATRRLAGAVTARIAKDGLQDCNPRWDGELTEPRNTTALEGQDPLTPGATYHLHLPSKSPANKQAPDIRTSGLWL